MERVGEPSTGGSAHGGVTAPVPTAGRVGRSLGFQVFASESHAPRARRAIDVATFLGGALLVAAIAAVADDNSTLEQNWSQLAESLPGWLQWLAEVTYFLAGVYLGVLIVGVGLVARQRKDLLRDILVALVLSGLVVVALGRIVSGEWPDVVLFDLSGTAASYPAMAITILTAVVVTASPHLTRPLRRIGGWIVFAAALAALLANLIEVRDTVGALVAGASIGAFVHLLFGSPAGRPSLGRVASALDELGMTAADLAFAPDQGDASTGLTATVTDGRPIEVTVYGRDAARSQRIDYAWRTAWYRDSPRPSGASRLELVEHAALTMLLAERGEVRVPEVITVGDAGAGDALLVTSATGRPLAELDADELDNALLADAWGQLSDLHAAGVAHGRPNLDHIGLDADGGPVLSGFDVAQVSAPRAAMLADRAELLTATALVVGNERALAAARAALGDDGLVAVLPSLQSAGISPELRSLVRHDRFSLKKLRKAAAELAGAEVPEMEKLHRVSLGQVAMSAFVVFAVYAVISAVADVGWSTIADALAGASWGLILVALVIVQFTNVGGAYAVLGAAPKPLPLGIVTVEQFAVGFINLAVPSTAARMAMNIRFAQRLGLAVASAVTLGALTGLAGFVVQVVLLFLLVVPGDNSVDWSQLQFGGTGLELLVLAAVIGLVALVVVALRPKLRAKALDRVREPMAQARDGVALLRSPRQALMLFGGNFASQMLFAAGLDLCLRAVGGSLGFGTIVFINTVVSLFAGMMPVPGGIGVTEAGLVGGLTAAGVSQDTAIAAVIVYRLCSFYLPPIWGWFSLRWLTRNDYL